MQSSLAKSFKLLVGVEFILRITINTFHQDTGHQYKQPNQGNKKNDLNGSWELMIFKEHHGIVGLSECGYG